MAFNIGFYAYAIIGHTRADQLLPQLLMEHFDTLPIQCRHIEHINEEVLDGWLKMGLLPRPLGNFADISYLVEN